MAFFEVDSERIGATSSEVRARAHTISAEVAAMMSQLIDLQGCWKGAAAGAFAEVVATWQSTQRQVEAGLDQIMVALGAAASSYEQAEAHATRLFRY